MAAFVLADAMGADGIECDLQLSADGLVVIAHDESLERTSNGHGLIANQRLADLRRLDFGSWFDPAFRGETIPLAAELLDWASGRIWLNLELKNPALAAPLLALLQQFPGADVVVSSFNWRLLRRLRQCSPNLNLAVLSDRRPWRLALRLATELGAVALHPALRQVSRPLLRAAGNASLPIFPWTVDSPRKFNSLRRDGVSGVFTNRPELLQRCL